VQARDATSVYVTRVDGILEEVLVRPGDQVAKGQLLAQLRNIDIDIAIADLEGQRDVYEAQLAGLKQISFNDRRASAQIEQVSEGLKTVKEQLAQREIDRQKLRLVAPQAGTVLPPPLMEKKSDEGTHLAAWSGTPFDRENLGATLMASTKLCQIGDPSRLEARLVIDQGDIDLVEAGQRVEIILAQSADYVYVSHIERKASDVLKISPRHLSSLHGGDLPTQMSPDGVPRPLTPVYEALAPLPEEDPHGLLRIGLVGRAKISTPPRTLWDRLVRYASRTFNFEL
jgi:putative peptide zinc metalloprotease protein